MPSVHASASRLHGTATLDSGYDYRGVFLAPMLALLSPFRETKEASWIEGENDNTNYFVERSSNGRAEGFNRGLRGIPWRACGLTIFAHFRLRVLHAFG